MYQLKIFFLVLVIVYRYAHTRLSTAFYIQIVSLGELQLFLELDCLMHLKYAQITYNAILLCRRDDFSRIPEFAINPLAQRIVDTFFVERYCIALGHSIEAKT